MIYFVVFLVFLWLCSFFIMLLFHKMVFIIIMSLIISLFSLGYYLYLVFQEILTYIKIKKGVIK